MKPEGRVGVVIPAFNAGHMVREAAESAYVALGSKRDVVIVDDGSTRRESRKVLAELETDGFVLVRQPNTGVSAARNAGLALLDTPYAFVLDADDLLEPAAPGTSADILDTDDHVVIVAGSGVEWGDGRHGRPTSPGVVTREVMRNWTMLATASCFRLRDWDLVGGFPEDCSIGEDWVFWMRLLRSGGRVAVSDELFVRHRIHPGQVTRSYLDPRETARARNLVMTENPDLFEAHVDELIAELAQARAVLADYRHAYRHADRLKGRVKRVLRRGAGDQR